MRGAQFDLATHLEGTNPNRTHAAHQRKGIVADDLRRAYDLKLDRIARKRPHRAELIRHTEDDAR